MKNNIQDDRIFSNFISQELKLLEAWYQEHKNLTEDQKGLLREYINNINNTGKLNQYVNEEVTKLVDSGSETKDR